jgi:hypothetical protein
MRIGTGVNTYEWQENWVKYPASESLQSGWSHHGVAISETGDIITYHPGDPTVMIFDQEGNLKSSWEANFADAHGITLVKDGDTEFLWVADNGAKRQAGYQYEYPSDMGRIEGKAIKMTLDGRMVLQLAQPDRPKYRDGDYKPTWVAVNEARNGGDGDVWVADGYGQNEVHRYTKNGDYTGTIDGTEGTAGHFNCPHAIFVDTRKDDPELYVADRGNGRIQVYDMDGSFKRSFGDDIFITPSGIVTDGDLMVVAELNARITILDMDDKLVTYLGDNHQVSDGAGWPNELDSVGVPSRTSRLEAGKFNSPHGLGVDGDGNLYVAEWLIGGRFTRLAKI